MGISKHTGDRKPAAVITAASGQLFVRFGTDAMKNSEGFFAEYSIGKYPESDGTMILRKIQPSVLITDI